MGRKYKKLTIWHLGVCLVIQVVSLRSTNQAHAYTTKLNKTKLSQNESGQKVECRRLSHLHFFLRPLSLFLHLYPSKSSFRGFYIGDIKKF